MFEFYSPKLAWPVTFMEGLWVGICRFFQTLKWGGIDLQPRFESGRYPTVFISSVQLGWSTIFFCLFVLSSISCGKEKGLVQSPLYTTEGKSTPLAYGLANSPLRLNSRLGHPASDWFQ